MGRNIDILNFWGWISCFLFSHDSCSGIMVTSPTRAAILPIQEELKRTAWEKGHLPSYPSSELYAIIFRISRASTCRALWETEPHVGERSQHALQWNHMGGKADCKENVHLRYTTILHAFKSHARKHLATAASSATAMLGVGSNAQRQAGNNTCALLCWWSGTGVERNHVPRVGVKD